MKKYIIKLENGKYVEQFYKKTVCQSENILRAGKYTKSIADKRLQNLNIKADLILAV